MTTQKNEGTDLSVPALEQEDMAALKTAKQLLENPGIVAKLTHFIGKHIEKIAGSYLRFAVKPTEKALRLTAKAALATMDEKAYAPPSNALHKTGAAITGAVGGAFGLPAVFVELPISTGIIFRSIADVARGEGANIGDPQVTLECLEVFALGGKSETDDGSETGYIAARIILAESLTKAAEYLATRGAGEMAAPALIGLIEKIAARYSVEISRKAAAQSIPIIGAVSGALINLLFIEHFQDMARGHFIVRRLESKYGKDLVWQEYKKISLPKP